MLRNLNLHNVFEVLFQEPGNSSYWEESGKYVLND